MGQSSIWTHRPLYFASGLNVQKWMKLNWIIYVLCMYVQFDFNVLRFKSAEKGALYTLSHLKHHGATSISDDVFDDDEVVNVTELEF